MDMETVKGHRQSFKPIRRETMVMVERVAFECLLDTMVMAFRRGGMANLFPFLEGLLHELNKFALDCEGRGWDEQLQRAIVSSRLATEYLPKMQVALDVRRDSQRDFERREAVWESMLTAVPAQDRPFVESIKEADSVLAMLLASRAGTAGAP